MRLWEMLDRIDRKKYRYEVTIKNVKEVGIEMLTEQHKPIGHHETFFLLRGWEVPSEISDIISIYF
jgi:hypothetical protein